MQRIFVSQWTPEEYHAIDAHEHVAPESVCPSCKQPGCLHRHGRYQRWVVTVLGLLFRLWIARFRCPACRCTISYLPDFALTYRPLGPNTFSAFLEGNHERPDVRSFRDRLRVYQRHLVAFGEELVRTVGAGLGLAPPLVLSELWPWLKEAGDGLTSVTRQLVTTFRIGLFRRYQCHQPAGP